MFDKLRKRYGRVGHRYGLLGQVAVLALAGVLVLGGAAVAQPVANASQGFLAKVLNFAKTANKRALIANKRGVIAIKGVKRLREGGVQGPPGPKGDKGDTGNTGPQGPAGASVEVNEIPAEEAACEELGGAEVKQEGAAEGVEVCNGEEGSPWTAGGTLPSGETLRGVWAFGETQFNSYVPVSFGIPLAEAPTLNYLAEGEGETEACPGTAEEPEAAPGNLCVYTTNEFEKFFASFLSEVDEGGAVLFFSSLETGSSGNGPWVVTAP